MHIYLIEYPENRSTVRKRMKAMKVENATARMAQVPEILLTLLSVPRKYL